jgi:hypothetical protein
MEEFTLKITMTSKQMDKFLEKFDAENIHEAVSKINEQSSTDQESPVTEVKFISAEFDPDDYSRLF